MKAEAITAKLATNDRWLIRAVVAIFEKQTADEQESEETVKTTGSASRCGCMHPFQFRKANPGLARRTVNIPNPAFPPANRDRTQENGKVRWPIARIAAARTAPAAEPQAAPAGVTGPRPQADAKPSGRDLGVRIAGGWRSSGDVANSHRN